jgi:hypothetical protein
VARAVAFISSQSAAHQTKEGLVHLASFSDIIVGQVIEVYYS